jgi:hypothetical protein
MGERAEAKKNMKTDDREQSDKPNERITETTRRAIRYFRDLDVYQNALETGLRVYELSKKFPDGERYALTDQIRRSSRSVCTNIAEAWRKRRYIGQLVRMIDHPEKWVIRGRMNT